VTLTPTAPAPALQRDGIFGSLAEVGHDLWTYRELLYQLALRDVRIRYKQAVMGLGWAIFMPLLIVLAGCLIRLAMAFVSGTEINRAAVAGLALKGLGWSFFVGALGFAVQSLTGNLNLVTKIYFPREVLPLATVLAQSFDTSVGAAAVAVMFLAFGVGHAAGLVWVPVLAVVLFLLTAATCLLLSCANLFFRDVKYIVQVLLMFGIFFTPVLWEPAMLGPLGARLIMLNPVAPVLEGLRLAIIEGHNLLLPLTVVSHRGADVLAWHPAYLIYSTAVGILGAVGSAVVFHRLEFLFAEYI
jgi:ABC-type polysaccharide/polyol phosphate export permease